MAATSTRRRGNRGVRLRLPISASLTLLVAVVLVPSLAFGGLLVDRYATAVRAANSAAAENAASRAADVLDRELATMLATLNAMSRSPALAEGNLGALAQQAQTVLAGTPRVLVVSGPDGRELFRTAGPLRAGVFRPLPGQPPGTDLLTENGASFVRLSVPVRVDNGPPRFFLSIEMPAPVMGNVMGGLGIPDGWLAALVDSHDVIIARTREPARFVGQLAAPDLRANAVGDEGSYRGTTLEGQQVISGYARMHLASWRVATGAPVDLVEEPLRRGMLLLIGGGLLLALGSTLLAGNLARRITRPLHDLAGAGAVLSRGDVLPPVATGVREVAFVASALRTASIALRNRSDALNAERTRLAAIIETVPVGLLIVTPEMDVLSSNSQMAELLGRPVGAGPATLDLRMADGSLVPAEAWPTARAVNGEANPELECRLHRGDGTAVWIYLIAAPIRDRAEVVTAAVVAALDIEEIVRARDEKARSALRLERQVAERTGELERANVRLRDEMASRAAVEAQLRQVQKMEAVGQLTGGIAHDFNNLLTVVVGCMDMLRRRVPEERSRRLLDSALAAAGRAATLTARLLAFSRQQPLMPRALDLNGLVEDMADLLRRTLGETVEFVTVLEPDLWPVHADPNQVENVLLNLAVNAKDAIAAVGPGNGGRLTVSTANTTLTRDMFVDVAAGEYVRLAVSDTGAGMGPEVIARAFEPFFTTKPIGQGTGLGLSQVHGFVKQSGGHVEIESRRRDEVVGGHGTTVTIFLPREPSGVPVPVPAAAPAAPAARGRGTVLLVEDEPEVRHTACEALEELGYTVLLAGDAAEAVRVLGSEREIDLLFTDMALPGSSGRLVAEEARRSRPGLPVLFTTGHAAVRVLREGRLGPGEGLVAKPFTVEQLAASVAALVG